MYGRSKVGQQPADALPVRSIHEPRFPEIPFPLGTLLGKNMTFIGFTVNDLLLSCHLEPFLGSLVRL